MINHASILIVEDEAIARDNLTHVMTEAGHMVVAVSSGTEALQKIGKQEFELVLTDLMLPGMNGIELLEHIKEIQPSTQVIVITGHATVDTAVIAMQKGSLVHSQAPQSG